MKRRRSRGSAGLPLGQQRARRNAPAGPASDVIDRVGRHGHRPGQRVERNKRRWRRPAGRNSSAGQRPAQARIGAQRLDQRRRLRPSCRRSARHRRSADRAARCGRRTRRPAAPRPSWKCSRSAASAAVSLAGSLVDQLRGRRVDDHQHALLGKRGRYTGRRAAIHGRSRGNSSLMSVAIAKCVAA